MKSKMLFLAAIMIAWVACVFDFCALHDIANDYLSPRIISEDKIVTGNTSPPEWTRCEGEWTVVQVGFIIRIIFMLFASVIILNLVRNKSDGDRSVSKPA
jgi:hypothetical protein